MTVQELIDILLEVEDKTLQVTVWADQGQTAMEANCTGVQFVEKMEYMMETIAEEDLDDYPGAIMVYEIGAQ